jgi:hypothetical protein
MLDVVHMVLNILKIFMSINPNMLYMCPTKTTEGIPLDQQQLIEKEESKAQENGRLPRSNSIQGKKERYSHIQEIYVGECRIMFKI